MWARFRRPRKPQTPLEKWHAEYVEWLDDLQQTFEAFPDHTALEGQAIPEAEGRVLDDIANLYAEDACAVLEQMVLRGESLRRLLARRRDG